MFVLVLATSLAAGPGAASASAEPAAHAYDTVGYTYDAPALLSSPDAVATDALGSPAGSEVVSWVNSVSVGGFGVAAKTGSTALRGVDDVLGGLSKGKQGFVRTVPDEASLNSTFAELTQGGSPTTWKNFSGTVIERGDGVQVGLRSYSKSGGPTVDIRMPDGSFSRIHVDQ